MRGPTGPNVLGAPIGRRLGMLGVECRDLGGTTGPRRAREPPTSPVTEPRGLGLGFAFPLVASTGDAAPKFGGAGSAAAKFGGSGSAAAKFGGTGIQDATSSGASASADVDCTPPPNLKKVSSKTSSVRRASTSCLALMTCLFIMTMRSPG